MKIKFLIFLLILINEIFSNKTLNTTVLTSNFTSTNITNNNTTLNTTVSASNNTSTNITHNNTNSDSHLFNFDDKSSIGVIVTCSALVIIVLAYIIYVRSKRRTEEHGPLIENQSDRELQ
jgi:beta-lactamase regulating signal transducer with metallopeptidase domain